MGYINNPSVSNVMPSTPTASAHGSATRQRRKEARPGELLDAALAEQLVSITGGNGVASGLIDSHTGLADVLVLNGDTVEGHVGAADGTLAFTITLAPATGLVTFTEYRSAMAPPGTNTDDNEAVSLATGIVTLIATVTKAGISQDVTLDLGSRLVIVEDDPSISASGTVPSLTLSEAHLTATLLDDNIAGSAPNATLTKLAASAMASAWASSTRCKGLASTRETPAAAARWASKAWLALIAPTTCNGCSAATASRKR